MTTSLKTFIAHALSKGMDHQTIRMLLLSSGWKEKDISAALVSESLDMPVPVPGDVGGARDAFFHLLTFTTLYATVISVIVLVFDYINRYLLDAASRSYDMYSASDFSSIRWSLAIIIVSFPLFVFLARTLHKEMIKLPEKLSSGIRRWLTYITLFITACTLIGDVTTLFFYFLQGELTLRFILKVLALFLLSGLPFTYYFSVIRMDAKEYAASPMHKQFFYGTCLIVVLVFVAGIFIAGTPAYGRQAKLDEQRLNDLKMIENEVLSQVWGDARYLPPGDRPTTLPKPLPEDLATVAANVTYQKINITDPETGSVYQYLPKGNTFDLCADFTLARDLSYDVFWNHPADQYCFTIDALNPTVR